MKLRKVDPRKIVIPKVRVTSRFDEDTLKMLHGSMAAEGLVAPIICCDVEGKLTLVDGLHRLQEAIALNMPVIDVAVTEGDMVDVITRNLFMDHIRGKHPVSEMVTVVEELRKTYGLDMDAVAKKTGMKREYVESLALVAELTPMIREALDQGDIKMGHAIALTRIKDPVRQEECFGNIKMYGMTVAAARGYITETLTCMQPPEPPKAPPPAPPPIKFKCAFCEEHFLADQVTTPFICRGCSGAMFASAAELRRIEAKEQAANSEWKSAAKEKAEDLGTGPDSP